MSLLNGGLPKAKNLTGPELDWSFIDTITPDEWEILRTYFGPGDRISIITAVAGIRRIPRYPLPAEHPLNPAARFEVTA